MSLKPIGKRISLRGRHTVALAAMLGLAIAGVMTTAGAASAATAPTAAANSAAPAPYTIVVSAVDAAKLGVHLQPGHELVHSDICDKPRPGAKPGSAPLVGTCSGPGNYSIREINAKSSHAKVTPNTQPDSWCTDTQGEGWFGIEPGDSSDGGVAPDLWITTSSLSTVNPLVIEPGNGADNQQWCFAPLGNGYQIYAIYGSLYECMDITNGEGVNFAAGTRLQAYPCSWDSGGGIQNNQLWYACNRGGFGNGDISLKPAATSASVWMDVWGGPGRSAFAAGHPMQIWNGNGADNQRYTLYPSPGSQDPNGDPVTPGC